MDNMKKNLSNDKVISNLFFRLLPAQILLIAIPGLNGIISSLFGSNMLGPDAVSAIGMYSPVLQFMVSIGTMMMGGSQILCGKYMGSNQMNRTQDVFMLDITCITILSVVSALLFAFAGMFDLTGFLSSDAAIRALFNKYLIGIAIGIVPMMIGNQLSAFLSMEMQGNRSTIATLLFVVTNFILTFLFLNVFKLGIFGLALASSIGYWVYLIAQASYYFSGKSLMKFKVSKFRLSDIWEIIVIGFPGAVTSIYLTVRRFVLNGLILQNAGSVGLSAYSAADTLLGIFWAVPLGMAAVARILMSVSIGEEDRQTLKNIVKTMLTRCMVLVTAMVVVLILCAVPLTRLYYRDVANPVYGLTITAFRLLPICMPLGLVCMTAVQYGQVSKKQLLVHSLSMIDGMLCPCLFGILLVPVMGMNGIYAALIINGIVTVIYPYLFSVAVNKKLPKNFDELLMIPDEFGAPEDARLDISLNSMDEVVNISEQIQAFCTARGLDARRSYLSGLFLEEMAGNIVEYGVKQDRKKHSIDVRVVHKNDDIILRIKDDCAPFDPVEQAKLVSDNEDIMKNVGIRMVYKIARDINYQNILGLNVLTIRI